MNKNYSFAGVVEGVGAFLAIAFAYYISRPISTWARAAVTGIAITLFIMGLVLSYNATPFPQAAAAPDTNTVPQGGVPHIVPTQVDDHGNMRFFTGNLAMPGSGPITGQQCRTWFLHGHEAEQTGSTDIEYCGPKALTTETPLGAHVGKTPTVVPTASPTIVVTESPTVVPTGSPTTETPTVVPTGTPPSVTETPTVEPTATQPPTVEPTATQPPTVEPTETQPPTVAPTETQTPNCNNGAGNGNNCTPGNSSGNNQGQGVPTGDQTEQGENGNGNNPTKTPKK